MSHTRSLLLFLAVLALTVVRPAIGAESTQVKVETSAGDFTIQLDAERAPLTVANFLKYVTDGFYDGTVFHRVVSGFVIQGGGYTTEFTLKTPGPALVNESGNGLSNRRGTVAMARTGEAHSADSQFFINLADNVALDPKPTRWGYAVFGEVVQGLEVVDEIGHRATSSKAEMHDVPVEPVIIRKISILKTPVAR